MPQWGKMNTGRFLRWLHLVRTSLVTSRKRGNMPSLLTQPMGPLFGVDAAGKVNVWNKWEKSSEGVHNWPIQNWCSICVRPGQGPAQVAKHSYIFMELYMIKGIGYLLLLMSIILPSAPVFAMPSRVRHMKLVFLWASVKDWQYTIEEHRPTIVNA